ncbi:choice-of-anchor D domain-containing protein [Micromonospora sp. NBC_00421]|uniref:choice-of-anchor D domain-containing protein n=1 Tax=Micromonospora sp. NBC_00421 TaxID=2975976 RepID=UPI002E1D2EEF
MRIFRALLGMSVAGACALAVLPGVALAAPTAPYTVVTLDIGETSSPAVKSGVFSAPTFTVSVLPQTDGSTWMYFRNGPADSRLSLQVRAPLGQSFVAGRTYPTTRFGDEGTARLDITSDYGCGNPTGSLTVRAAGIDPLTDQLTSLAASYSYNCDNRGDATGEIRWNSDVEYAALVSAPAPVDFGQLKVESPPETRTVTYRSEGTLPVTLGSATLAGTDPAHFQIATNACTGRTLAPGASCTMTVSATARRAGTFAANLVLADDSAYGKRLVRLTFTATDTAVGTYYPVGPSRVMDTRSGLGVRKGKLGPGQKVDLQITGRGGVPSGGVGSVVLNVTVANPTASSFLTVYPAGEGRPTASSINFPKSWLGSNNVTVKLGSGGKVSVYNHAGSTDAVVDVVGWYAGSDTVVASRGMGGQYQWFNPVRILDTRAGGGKALPGGWSITAWVDFVPEFKSHVRAYVLNITAVSPKKNGYLTAWSGMADVPLTSTVNYAAGKVVPNLAIVESSPCFAEYCDGESYGAPSYEIYTSATSHIVVDLVGVIDDATIVDGLRFTPRSPTRIVDSRTGQGIPGALGPGSVRKVSPPPALLTDTTEVVAMNVTAVAPSKNTVVTVWPADTAKPRPNASNLNPAAGQTVSNAVLGQLGPNQAFNVHNLSGNVHLVADVVGTFYRYSGTDSRYGRGAARTTGRPTVVGAGALPPTRR